MNQLLDVRLMVYSSIYFTQTTVSVESLVLRWRFLLIFKNLMSTYGDTV